MINAQVLKGNLIRQDYTTAFVLNQGDKGVPFKIELLENGTPYILQSTDIVTIEWLKPNGSAYLQEGNIKYGTNYIEFTTPEAIAQYSGSGSFNIIISNGDVRKGTIRREYKVVPTSMKPGSVSEDTVTDAITELRSLSAEIASTVQNNQELINNNTAATKSDIATVNSSLEEKVNTNDLLYVTLEQFGGKSNDTTFDNSSILYNCLKSLTTNKKQAVLQLGVGTYTFLTPVVIDFILDGITIKGVEPHSTSSTIETIINYTGTGFWLTLQDGGLYYNFENFNVKCNGADGIHVMQGNQVNVWNKFKNVRITKAIKGMLLEGLSYTYLENLSVDPYSQDFEYGIKIITVNRMTELVYLDKVIVSGNSTSTGDGIIIDGVMSIFLNNLDVCGIEAGTGVLISSDCAETHNVNITNCNFIRNMNHIKIEATNNVITSINLDNNHHIFGLESEDEIGINIIGNTVDDKVVQHVNISNPVFRSTKTFKGYDYYIANEKVNNVKLMNKSSLTTGKWRHKFDWNGTIYEGERNSKLFTFTGDGTTTVFKSIITSNSYYDNPPVYITNCELPIPYSVSYSNTYGGEFSVTFTFATAPREGEFKLYGIKTNCGYR